MVSVAPLLRYQFLLVPNSGVARERFCLPFIPLRFADSYS